jgi:hypothetical protein
VSILITADLSGGEFFSRTSFSGIRSAHHAWVNSSVIRIIVQLSQIRLDKADDSVKVVEEAPLSTGNVRDITTPEDFTIFISRFFEPDLD